MSRDYKIAWSFETANHRIELRIHPEDLTPDWLEDGAEQDQLIEDINNGNLVWFMAEVVVFKHGVRLGTDMLGGCCYKSIEEFVTSHRDSDTMKRNSSLMRAAEGQNVSICHYFPGMVSDAISNARKTLASLCDCEEESE